MSAVRKGCCRLAKQLPCDRANIPILQVAPGAGRVTRLSAPPPVSTPKEVSPPSTTNGSANDIGGLAETSASHERDVADMTKAELAQERRSLLMKLFADTGTAKIPAVIRWRPRSPKCLLDKGIVSTCYWVVVWK